MNASTLLVTGATGNIGRALVPLLQNAGAKVIAGSRSGEAVNGAPGRVIDYNDRAALEAAFQDVDTLFLLFPLVPNKRELARNAVAAARAAGVKHIVRSSGAGADPHASGSLVRLQGEIDQIVLDSGIPSTLVRPSNFMQNWVAYFAGMVKSGTVYLSLAEGKTAFIDVRDIAAVDAAILLNPAAHAGKAYTVTGPEALGVTEVLAEINRATGSKAVYVPVPEAAAEASMKSMGMDDWAIDVMSSLNQATAAGATAQVTTDVERITGRKPRSFADFVRDHADAWR